MSLINSERRYETESTEDSQQAVENYDSEVMESSIFSARSKLSRRGPIKNNEVASEAAYMVSEIITSILYKSRPASKAELFNNILYLFTGWAQHGIKVDQKSLEVKWLKPVLRDVSYVENLPNTRTFRLADLRACEDSLRKQLDLDNDRCFESFIGEHPELTLVV